MIARRTLLRAFAALVALAPGRGRATEGPVWARLPSADTLIERVAFGSCNDQRQSQAFWQAILDAAPQLLVLMGDNVYGDVSSAAMTELKEAYARLAAEPAFQTVRARIPILATWDDHDYGQNDAGGDFPYRREAQALFHTFWQVPPASPRGQRDGLYDAVSFGPAGQRVQILLLDTRSFRSPLRPTDARGEPGKERYLPDPDPEKTLLGAAQWAWLEEQLRKPADVRLLISSIQVLANVHGWERWGNLPHERDRLFRLLGETCANGLIILSGDRHLGAMYRRSAGVPYALTEITSSSFNRPFSSAREHDPEQLQPIVTVANFGMVRIDWPARRVTLELRGDNGALLQAESLGLASLRCERQHG